ncbi:MAG: glycosyltransferase family 2 protein [Clostridia bacterium]|nr:glycosyltransferase family 2 protein [Clostridia bacterium]
MEDNIEKNVFFDFKRQPGKRLIENIKINDPKISVITSYYNYKDYIMQTYRSLSNQTFPYWEWIIVNDGSTEENTEEVLSNLKALDDRIKIYNKENEGLAKGRDYGISKSTTDLIFPLDADDLIEPTTLECSYWALKTNPKAAWAYTNIVNFGEFNDLDKRAFDVEKMKVDNMITATALIRKQKILELGGYSIAKRYVNEDWHLWLRMMQKGNYPVEIGFYGFWYRRKKTSLLTWINSNENNDNEKRKQELEEQAKKINKEIKAKIYPNNSEEKNKILDNSSEIDYSEVNNVIAKIDEQRVLYITNTLNTDTFKLDLLKKIHNENKKITILTTHESPYIYRQKFEEYAEVFDLSTFIDKKHWKSFIQYIVHTRNIKRAYMLNCDYEEDIETIIKNLIGNNYEKYRYDENNDLYFEEIAKYKKSRRLINRIIKKIWKGC